MNSPRLVRGSKSRLFLYLGALSLVGLTVYLYHGVQMQLDDAKRVAGKCSQQQESLSAQLQVIFEYKLRLEKSLQQEKNEHRQTRDELQAKATAEKLHSEKEIQETMNKYTSLQQQHKLLKSQHGDLDEECRRARDAQATLEQAQAARGTQLEELKASFMQLEAALETERKLHAEAEAKEAPLVNAGRHLEKKIKQLEKHLALADEKLKACQLHEPLKTSSGGRIEKPALVASKTTESGRLPLSPDIEEPDKLAGNIKSTTPQINPDALSPEERGAALPVPPPQKQALRLPDGVVPAPEGFAEETRKEVREVNQLDSPWGWHKIQPAQHFEDNHIPEKQFQHNLLPAKQFEQNNQLPMNQFQNHPLHQFAGNHFPVNQIDRNQYDQNQVPANHDGNHFPLNQFAARNQIPANQFQHNVLQGNQFGHNQKQANHFGQQQLFNPADNQQPIHLQRNQHDPDQARLHNNLVNLQHLNAANQRQDVARPANHNAAFLANDLANGRPVANQNGAYPYNGDYEKDGQRNDLQLEENEEEEDDDVDQIDYGNDNNKKKEEKRDGVMVNPK